MAGGSPEGTPEGQKDQGDCCLECTVSREEMMEIQRIILPDNAMARIERKLKWLE